MVSLSDTTLYLCYRRHTAFHTQRYCLGLHHLFWSHWRLWPSRRRNRSRVTQRLISCWYSQTLQGASEGARLCVLPHHYHGAQDLETFKSFHDIATATWMTRWNQAGMLMHFSPFSKNLSALLLLFWPPWGPPPPSTPKLLSGPSSVFLSCPLSKVFFPFFNQSDRPSSPSPPHRPLRTNWAL